ncbi:hypothetical protein RhiirB3_450595 [Rhizophagus irregularis]|nr:hypothetical protein RhiirB3_450595 [Rhizophagus irregularis]
MSFTDKINYFGKLCESCGKTNINIRDRFSKWCKLCQINQIISLRNNFINWTSGNEEIDSFIRQKQTSIIEPTDTLLEWIPYNQFIDIKEIEEVGKNKLFILYSAKWKNGPLEYNENTKKCKRNPNKAIILKCFNNIQDANKFLKFLDEFLNEANEYFYGDNKIYGISQNPDTKYYTLCSMALSRESRCQNCNVIIYANKTYKWCLTCQISCLKENFKNWASGNGIIDHFIQKKQLNISQPTDIVIEWIPYNQFNDIKEISNDNSISIHLAKWKDGPLEYNKDTNKYERNPNKAINLKFLLNTQVINEFLNEAEKYLIEGKLYGISQNPDTRNYIMVVQNMNCENCYEVYTNRDMWTFNTFNDIKKIGKNMFATFYLAKWKDGPLEYNKVTKKYERNPNKVIVLKYYHNIVYPNIVNTIPSKYLYNMQYINRFLDEVEWTVEDYQSSDHDNNTSSIYGMSQHPYTKDYIIVFRSIGCKRLCLKDYFTNPISRNINIENSIREIHLDNNDIIFEWIPYNHFDNIKKIGKNLYSAIWKDSSLNYDMNTNKYESYPSRAIILKYLFNIRDVFNEVNKYFMSGFDYNYLKIYGISQSPDIKDYIIIFNEEYFCNYHCKNCGKEYADIQYKWCKSCQMNYLKENSANWITENGKIENINMVFKWKTYEQFIKKIEENNLVALHSVIWRNGSLNCGTNLSKYEIYKIRDVMIELRKNSRFSSNKFELICPIIEIYGISQNSDIKNYVIIFNDEYFSTYNCKNCYKVFADIQYKWCKQCQINYLKNNFTNWTSENENIDNFIQKIRLKITHPTDVIFEWIPYNQFGDIKEIGKLGFGDSIFGKMERWSINI